MVSATSSSDKSDTSVSPWVILGSPLGPVNKTCSYEVLQIIASTISVPKI